MSARRTIDAHYETSLDRAGWAIATGGLIGGTIAVILLARAGESGVAALVSALLTGAALTALGITALGVLPWTVLHIGGRRGPVSAAALGAAIGFLLFLAGQTYGYGLFGGPEMDGATLLTRWLSAIATSLVIALLAAGIAVAMWRVAYRRVL